MMRRLITRVRRLVFRDDGPTAVEYAVMLALILMVCVAAIRTFGSSTKTMFTNIGNSTSSGS